MKIKNLLTTLALTATFLFIGNVGWGQYTGTGTFNKITSISDLTAGYYVVANSTDAFAMNNTMTTYFGNTAITPSSGVITNPATSIVWKIETNGTGWSIYNEASAKYVSYTGTSNSAQAVDAVTTDNQRWTITYASSLFVVTNIALPTRILQYNSSSPRFACYTGSQTNLNLYKLTVDNTAPSVVPASLIPADNATDININTTLTIPFDENIQKGTGYVRVKKSDDTEIFAIDVTTAAVSVTSATATVTLPSNLANSTDYYVNIDAGAFKDMANNNFTGLTDKTTWNFTTIAAGTPTITLTSPNGGEKYYAGQSVNFTWTSANMDAENVKIEAYVRDGFTTNWNWVDAIPTTANDGSESFIIPAGATSGAQYKIKITGLTSSATDESNAAFTVIATPSINQIQSNNTAGASAWLGELVKITGVVTAVTSDTKNYYLQNGSGAWNGIYVYNNATHTYAVGNNLSIEGTVDEFNNLTQIKTVTSTVVNNPTDVVPAAAEISTLDATTENYEGVLVKVKKAECKSGSAGTYVINDGTGDLTAYKGIYGAFALTTGRFYNITGVMTWYNNSSIFELLPRNASDVYELSNDASIGLSGLGGKSINELAGLKVTDPATDAGATLFFDDFTGLKGISISALNANATLEVKLNGAVVDPANYADQALAQNDVIVAKITSEDGIATNYYKVTLKFENRVITVTAPTGGQTYNTGDVVTITWTATNVSNVNIWAYVTIDDVLVQLNTTPISAATGTFDYTIKNGNSGIVYIVVSDANDDSFYAQSAGTVTVIDNVKPAITSRYPAVNKYGIGSAFTIELNFDESIKAGAGNLKVFKASDNSEVKTATAAELTIDGTKATLAVTGLDYTVGYYITADAGLIKDNSNNESDAINANDWKFTTMAPRSGDLFFSEYIEGSSNNKALEIYNPTSEPISLNNYRIAQSNNGGGWAYYHTFPADKTIAPGDVWVIITNSISTSLFDAANADEVLAYPAVVYHTGNDARGLEKTTNGTDWTLIDVIGNPTSNTDFDVAGVTAAAANHTLVRKSTVVKGNTDWAASAGTNADNSEWIVKNVDDFSYLGSHNMTLSSANAITTFSIANQVSSTIDANAKTVSVVMPYGVALTNLTPTITLSFGAYTIPASGVAQDFSSAFEYVAIAMDGTANVWTVTVTNAAASNAKEIVSFSIPSQVSSTIVAATSTVNVVVPTGTNLTSLTPTITLSPYATIDPASGVARNFSSAVTYTVTAQDGSTKVWTINVSIGSSAPDQPFASFKAYPNPFSNEIRFDGAEIARVTITSIIGQVVMDKTVAGENLVETQNLSKGIYLVKFTNIKGESVLRKLIKE